MSPYADVHAGLQSYCSRVGTVAVANSQRLRAAGPLVQPLQWEHMGGQLLGVLTALKHNGAIQKAQAGFHAVCAR